MRLLVNGVGPTLRGLLGRWRDRLGCLMSPAAGNSMASVLDTGLPWAADNGAFGEFDPEAFRRMLARIAHQPRCLWVACPDVVGDASATLALFGRWHEEVRAAGQPVALVGQDGADAGKVPWGAFDAYFIGGTTGWKLSQASADLALAARRRGKAVHMGRVNSRRRMVAAHQMGCGTLDGSSASWFGATYIERYCVWLGQIEGQQTLLGNET